MWYRHLCGVDRNGSPGKDYWGNLAPFIMASEVSAACRTWKEAQRDLLVRYGEVLVGRGLEKENRAIYALFIDPIDGSWSVAKIAATGCVTYLTGGDYWMKEPPKQRGPRL